MRPPLNRIAHVPACVRFCRIMNDTLTRLTHCSFEIRGEKNQELKCNPDLQRESVSECVRMLIFACSQVYAHRDCPAKLLPATSSANCCFGGLARGKSGAKYRCQQNYGVITSEGMGWRGRCDRVGCGQSQARLVTFPHSSPLGSPPVPPPCPATIIQSP